MPFNSYEFILLFLPITFFLYFLFNKFNLIKISQIFLIIASIFFYSFGSFYSLGAILISIFFNYLIGFYLFQTKKKLLLITGIVLNILFLILFKYHQQILELWNLLKGTYHTIPKFNLLTISFVTFQQIIYLVESYKGRGVEKDFLNYLFFITFFPKVIAGPLIQYNKITSQLSSENTKKIDYNNISKGLFIFFLGLFQKVMLADVFAIWADIGFDKTLSLNFVQAWIVSLSFTFQIYFDISGYSLMAIGSALLFNIKLPFNLNIPYKSYNILEFWEKWFITLTQFFNHYVYIPLKGKNSSSAFGGLFWLLITFLIVSLWHDLNLTFIFWGLLQVIGISIFYLWKKVCAKGGLPRWLTWFITFNFINFSWIFFRANNLIEAKKIISGMLNITTLFKYYNEIYILWALNANFVTIIYLFLCFFMLFKLKSSNEYINNFQVNKKYLILTVIMAILSLIFLTERHFIYYRF